MLAKTPKLFSALLVVVLTSSCSKDKIPTPVDDTLQVTKVELTSSAELLFSGTTKKITFSISPANATELRVAWMSTNPGVATVDSTGLVTAVANGDTRIIASSLQNTMLRDTTNIAVLKDYDVHAVGVEYLPMAFKRGIYWRNQDHQELPGNLSICAEANAIKISGDDIYIAGVTINAHNWSVPTLWKNSAATELTATNLDRAHYVTGIDIDGGDVYVSGWDFDLVRCPDCNYVSHGYYWKYSGGTVKTEKIFDDSSSTAALSVHVKDEKVFVSGWQANDNFFKRSKLWIDGFSNGKEFTSNSYSYANTLLVKGSDVYVAGFDGCPYTNCVQTAWLWKNDGSNPVPLTDGVYASSVSSMTALGDDIIMAGFEKNAAGKSVAKYWILSNGKLKEVVLGMGESDSEIFAIQVVEDELFLAGYEVDSPSGYRQAKYWRSKYGASLSVDLLSGLAGTRHTQLNGIAVK